VPLLYASRERATLALHHPVQWHKIAGVPREAAAVLSALQFSGDARHALPMLHANDWKKALEFADNAGLTPVFGDTVRPSLPNWLREQMDRNIARNAERLSRLLAALIEVSARLEAQRLDYLLLKGFSQQHGYVRYPRLRMHYDNDLFAPPETLESAYHAIRSLGYEPMEDSDQPADHLSPLIRKTGWIWAGDPFDPEIPPSFELHFRFWDYNTERIPATGVEQFWSRRVKENGLPMLHPADRLAYAALHLLRHLFRGSLRAGHVHQIAYFLETKADDDRFWNTWHELHPDPLRRLEAVSFRLAAEWFGCGLAPIAREQIEKLDGSIPLWFEKYSTAPARSWFQPNKDELFLHLAMLESARDRRRVLIRKVFPSALPGPRGAVHVPDEQITVGLRWRQRVEYAAYVVKRAMYHARSLPVVMWRLCQWKTRVSGLEAPFWWFILSQSLFTIGFFLFYLLYNLYLLDRGYRENAIGWITSAVTAGGVAGMLPAASVVRRVGLKTALQIALLATPLVFALRCVLPGMPALLTSAFAGGACFSLFAVCMSPGVAALTTERARPAAFTILTSSGIGLGILSGLIGARIPGWFLQAGIASDAMHAKQIAMLAACGFASLGFWPMVRLRMESAAPEPDSSRYPLNSFMLRFLIATGLVAFALGAFDPFFNAYLSTQFRMPVARIGMVFSFAQGLQVAGVLFSPLLLRRFGLVRGVASMQFASALSLAALATGPVAAMAAIFYALHTCFMYMDDPGIYTLLMNKVSPGERSAASALQLLVAFGSNALAVSIAGSVITRYGYPTMLTGAALAGLAASALFWRLLRNFDSQPPGRTP
jgi:MFS family permease